MSSSIIDESTDFGARVLRRLQNEQIVWLTTVGGDGTPQPSPVWFLWQGGLALVYSRPDAPKLKNIARSPRVALCFNTTPDGGDVVVLTGTAEILSESPPANAVPEYAAKYDQGIRNLGMDAVGFGAAYRVAIRITLEKVRGF